jgi:hypothetical protein
MAEAAVEQAAPDAGSVPTEATTPEPANSDWRDAISEDIRHDPSLHAIKDVSNLAKSYVHAQRMVGRDKIALPGESGTPEEWSDFDARSGRPTEAANYDLNASIPAGLESENDAGVLEGFKDAAHAAGLRNNQAQAVLDYYYNMSGGMMEERTQMLEQARTDSENELRREYGRAYDERMGFAKDALAQFGSDDLAEMELSDGSKVGNNPHFAKMLANIGLFIREKIGEDSLEGDKRLQNMMTPQDAHDQRLELQRPGGPYWDKNHPQHKDFVQRALALAEHEYPEEVTQIG